MRTKSLLMVRDRPNHRACLPFSFRLPAFSTPVGALPSSGPPYGMSWAMCTLTPPIASMMSANPNRLTRT